MTSTGISLLVWELVCDEEEEEERRRGGRGRNGEGEEGKGRWLRWGRGGFTQLLGYNMGIKTVVSL